MDVDVDEEHHSHHLNLLRSSVMKSPTLHDAEQRTADGDGGG